MESNLILNELENYITSFSSIKFPINNKNLKQFKELLEDFLFWEDINPYLKNELIITKKILKKLELGLNEQEGLNLIISKLKELKILVSKKINIIKSGNKHLKELPIHPQNPQFFYAYAKEFNFASPNIIVRHPINLVQLAIQRKRLTKDLLKFDKKDPIEGKRFFSQYDNQTYPGSEIFIYNGNHRLYELYWRYIFGLVSGDQLIEIKNMDYN